jgi:large subunit ribosomal protein L6
MSRIGKKPVAIPAGVNVKLEGTKVTVKGPKGELSETFYPDVIIKMEGKELLVEIPDSPIYQPLHGMTRAKINNMVVGVTTGFKRELEIEGVGYKGELQGKNLVLSLGYSHPVPVEAPAGITLSVDKTQRVITIEGASKEAVGQLAANIRSLRPPEPYKGKGIHYMGEKIRRKAGKAGKTAAK